MVNPCISCGKEEAVEGSQLCGMCNPKPKDYFEIALAKMLWGEENELRQKVKEAVSKTKGTTVFYTFSRINGVTKTYKNIDLIERLKG